MAKDFIDIDDLIIKVLSGNACAQDCAALEEWISESADHRQHFGQMTDIWLVSGITDSADSFNAQAGFRNFMKKVQPVRQLSQRPPHRSTHTRRILKLRIPQMITLLVLCFVMGIFSYRYFDRHRDKQVSYYETIVPLGAKSQIVLTDGTKIWLNAGSKLRYSTSFAVLNREVQLEGEGYFEVAPDKSLPFVVKTSRLNVKAIGTAFNVKAYPSDSIVETILVEGKVDIFRIRDHQADEKAVSLHPKQRLTLRKQNGEMLVETKPLNGEDTKAPTVTAVPVNESMASDETDIREITATSNYMAATTWKDKRWHIDSEELKSLATKLERRYNVEIIFADSELEHYRFNGTLEDEPIEAVLKVMAQTAPVKFELSGTEVVLSHNNKFREQHKDLYKK